MVVDANQRTFIDHLVINEVFLRNHALGEVTEVLKAQGWLGLYREKTAINKDLIEQLFSTLRVIGEGTKLIGEYDQRGRGTISVL